MDQFTNIFSPESLRLLGSNQSSVDAEALFSLESWNPSDVDRIGSIYGNAPEYPLAEYDMGRSQQGVDTWYSTFPTSTDQPPKPKRKKFEDPNRRAEVAQVRKEGACMRCRLNKIPCSCARPCKSCISGWVSLNSRSTKLRWMSCVPFFWNNVNIYAQDYSHEDHDTIMQACSVLMNEHTALQFGQGIPWDITALSKDFAMWMAAENILPAATSRVGILSSTECHRILHNYLDKEICTSLGLLIKVSSLLYSRQDCPHPLYRNEHLSLIRSSVGTRLLKNLETALKATALAKASNEKLKALFLVLLGLIIATTYTTITDLEDARHELLRILSHHMIFIGERIGLLKCDSTKQMLTNGCHNMWNKKGGFEWCYGTPAATQGIDTAVSAKQSPGRVESSPANNFSLDSSRLPNPEESEHQLESTTSIGWTGDIHPQADSIPNAGSQSPVGTSQHYDWPKNFGTEHGSFSTSMETTTCFICNRSFPSDELCPFCFGPSPLEAGYNDVALQAVFDSTWPVPDIQVSDPMPIDAEFSPAFSYPQFLSTDTPTISSSLRRSEASSENLQRPESIPKPRTPMEEHPPMVNHKPDRGKTRSKINKSKMDLESGTCWRCSDVQFNERCTGWALV